MIMSVTNNWITYKKSYVKI